MSAEALLPATGQTLTAATSELAEPKKRARKKAGKTPVLDNGAGAKAGKLSALDAAARVLAEAASR
jgi:hypothetical protein